VCHPPVLLALLPTICSVPSPHTVILIRCYVIGSPSPGSPHPPGLHAVPAYPGASQLLPGWLPVCHNPSISVPFLIVWQGHSRTPEGLMEARSQRGIWYSASGPQQGLSTTHYKPGCQVAARWGEERGLLCRLRCASLGGGVGRCSAAGVPLGRWVASCFGEA
jgi:hypothetical protein